MTGTQLILLLAVAGIVGGAAYLLMRSRNRTHGTVTIGQQMADAIAAEKQRVARRGAGGSPMPGPGYDTERGDDEMLTVVPLPMDRELQRFVRDFAEKDQAARDELRDSLSLDDFYALITFARRSAVLALNDHDPERCSDGATALAMIDERRIDVRDAAWAAGILAHAAFEIDASDALSRAAELATSGIAERLSRAGKKRPDLADWGFVETRIDGRVGMVGTGYAAYSPTLPLLQIAREILAGLREGDYPTGTITVATELPTVWCSREHENEVTQLLTECPATVSVSARIARRLGDSLSHMWVAWIVETPSEARAAELLGLVPSEPRAGRYVTAVAYGRAVCVIVAGSVAEGVDPHESPDSIRAQAERIRRIMERIISTGTS